MEVCRALRQDPAIPRPTPIIMITSEAAAQRRRLAALRAGAWDCLGLPLDAEELLLKLETYVHVKMETDRVREEGSVDEASGLYTARGLERRARELVADAFRRHAALGCVALGVEPELREASRAQAGTSAYTNRQCSRREDKTDDDGYGHRHGCAANRGCPSASTGAAPVTPRRARAYPGTPPAGSRCPTRERRP